MNTPKDSFSRPMSSRKLRYFIEQALPIVGMAIVFGGAMLITDILWRVIVVAVGLLLVEIAVWNLASRILPNSRQYVPFRNEVDRFIQLARSLNAAAVTLAEEETAPERRIFDTVRDDMVAAVNRMAGMAGKTEAQSGHQSAVVDLARSEAVTSEDDAGPQEPERPPSRG
jgi:hypothetical protein